MKELSLFSGAGGGVLGTKMLGFEHIGYVEFNEYCQQVLAQRIKDGLIDNAPIFGDIRAFIDQGYCDLYKGVADIVTAGFPCQPFSVTGKRLGEDDERNMWPYTLECIRRVEPRYCFLENVPGLLSSGYAQEIFSDLANLGFDAKWTVLGSNTTNSCCLGKRLWIIAFKAYSISVEGLELQKHTFLCKEEPCRRQHTGAVREALSQDDFTRIKRDSDAVARGMERLKAVGNGQVPSLVGRAWGILSKGVIDE